jgi:hypothetical protein
MKKVSIDFDLLLMRVDFSSGIITNGYRKFLKVIQANFRIC